MSATTLTALIARCRALCRPRLQEEDAELLRRFARQREAAAFEELLERYAPLVWGVCRRMLPSEADCEDAFQATFLALVRKPDSLDPGQALGGWLHTVAVRVVRKAQARARRQRPQAVVPVRATAGDVADEVGSRELFRMVDAEIERLPALLREPLILCCRQGRTRDEAAESLGCSVAAVKSRLERGRELLRRRLQRRGVQLPAAFLALGLTTERIRAALWAKTMQAVLFTPAPGIVALAEAGVSAVSLCKYKLLLAALLLVTSAAGAASMLLMQKPAEVPAIAQDKPIAAEPNKPEAPEVRRDRYGDPLPDGAIARLGTVRWRYGSAVFDLAYSPDGKRIVTAGIGPSLVLWDAASGRKLRVFPSRGQTHGVAFSPDGKWIATTCMRGQLWDAATGKMLWELKKPCRQLNALAFAPDGKTLATANGDGALHLWNAATGDQKLRIDCGQEGVNAVAYSPDGATLASGGSDGTVCLWDAETGKERSRFTAAKKEIWSVVYAPDGKQLAVGSDEHSPRLWNVATGKEVRTFGDGKQWRFAPLAFSPDGQLLASGYVDGTFRLWDVASGEEKRYLRSGWGAACSVAFSPDGKTLASAVLWDGGIRLWDVATGRERHPSEAHHGLIPLVRFAADKGTLISAGENRNMLWWDLTTQTPRRRFAWTTRSTLDYDLSPDGNTLAVGDRMTHEVWLWDVGTSKATRLPGKHQSWIDQVVFSPDGRLVASGGQDHTIHVWEVRQGKEVRQIKDFKGRLCWSLRFSPDSTVLACVSLPGDDAKGEPTLQMWEVASAKERRNITYRTPIGAIAFSPDGKVLAVGDGNLETQNEHLVRLWDLAAGRELCRHVGHRRGIGAMAFSPDGKLVASSGDDNYGNVFIHICEAATGRLIRQFEGHHIGAMVLHFAADGLTMASGGCDSTILLWDVTGRRPDGRWHVKPLTPRQLDACWTTLANEDAAKAYDAVWALVAAPEQAVPFLKDRLHPVPRPDAKTIARLIADLDSDDFMVRQKATEELSKLGDAIAPDLRRTLENKPSLEVRRRIQQLLDQSRNWTGERLRDHRAIQALQHIGTRPAHEVLRALAEGAPEAYRTEEAKAALQRLRR